jgi:hypothetical protein
VLADPTKPWTPTPDQMVARGLRNPWRVTFDPKTGDVWVGDVGDLEIEEVDRIPAAVLHRRQVNFGYPYYEGSIAQYHRIPRDFTFTHAVLERHHGAGVCGMVGGFVYRGTGIPALRGRYVYGDLCGMAVRAFRPGAHGHISRDGIVASLPEPIVSFGQSATGELYALGSEGGVFRLDSPAAPTVPDMQSPTDEVTTTTTPVKKVDCGVVESIQPFGFMGGMKPAEVKDALKTVNETLATKVPKLPAHLRPYGEAIQRTFTQLTQVLAPAKWDMSSPGLSTLRTDMLDATGPFTGFPQALADLFDSECA